MILFFVVVLGSLAGSFICSLCEAALYSVNDVRVASMVNDKRPGAALLQKLRGNIDRAIAAILTINTITHTAGAAIGGAIIGDLYDDALLGVFTAVFTVLLLFGTEIIPKSIGVAKADSLAPRIAWIIQTMIFAVYPLVRLCEILSRLIIRDRSESAPSEFEILAMTRAAARHGVLPPHEAQIVANALKLNDIQVREIMTPRSVVFALPDTLPLARLEQHSEHWVHSRLPVVRDSNPNEVRGIVHRRDVFDLLVHETEGAKTLSDVMRPARFIRDTARADEALLQFLAGRQHMFIVLDEFGLFVGIITLEDVLESLLGREIVGEHDPVTDMQALARKKAADKGLSVVEPPRHQAHRTSAAAPLSDGA